jgi:hypothetical protein
VTPRSKTEALTVNAEPNPDHRILSRMPAQQAAQALSGAVSAHFRMPGTPDPAIRLRQLAVASTWAAALGFGGVILVLRIVFGLFTSIAGWYLPVIFVLGLAGITCTVGAFGSLHHRRLPWLLLGGATLAEFAGYAATLAL